VTVAGVSILLGCRSMMILSTSISVSPRTLAQGELLKGNPEPVKKWYSHREDVNLGNPFGPFVRGWEQVGAVVDHAASQSRDGGDG
jgi:hypothetical protein